MTFEEWARMHGGKSTAMETQDEQGRRTLIFANGAQATAPRPGTVFSLRRDQGWLDGWITTEPPGNAGTLAELEARKHYYGLLYQRARDKFDRIKAMLLGTYGGVIRWSGPDADPPTEEKLLLYKTEADTHRRQQREVEALIEKHPDTIRRREVEERSRQAQEQVERRRLDEYYRLQSISLKV